MIKHVVCFKLLDNSIESKQETKNILMSMIVQKRSLKQKTERLLKN